MSHLNLLAKAYHRILKLARAIAELAGSEQIQSGRGVAIWTKVGVGLIKTSLIFAGLRFWSRLSLVLSSQVL